MNHWIATNTTASYCLKNHQTCSKSHHLYTKLLKCPPSVGTEISDVDELKRNIKNEWADLSRVVHRMCYWRCGASVYTLAFAPFAGGGHFEYSVKMMRLITSLIIFETLTASFVCGYFMIHRNVHISTALTAQSVTSNFPRCFQHIF